MLRSALVLLAVCFSSLAAELPPYPVSAISPVTNTYHKVRVVEDYRWLEEAGDPAVVEWTRQQNAYSAAYFDTIVQRPAIAARLQQLYKTQPISYGGFTQRGSKFYALKRQPPKNQPLLVVRDGAGNEASEKVVLDLNVVNAKGTTSMDWYVPSHDGSLVAVCLSENGSEDGSVHVFEAGTGRKLPDVIARVQYPTGGGSVGWLESNEGFFYTRYPVEEGEKRNFYQQIFYHKLGTPSSADFYVLGKEFPAIAEIEMVASPDGKYLLAQVANGDGGDFSYYLRKTNGEWLRVAEDKDAVKGAVFGLDGKLYLLSRHKAPRGKILSMSLDQPRLDKARVVVAQGNGVIEHCVPTATRLYVMEMFGGPSRVRVFDLQGNAQPSPQTPNIAAVHLSQRQGGDEILLGVVTYLQPMTWYRYDATKQLMEATGLAPDSPVKFDDAEVSREMATSRDGTKVPVNIIRKKGTSLNGNNPVLLSGYGGYGISMMPSFSPDVRLWLDAGGIWVVANLRGGGEFGEVWHKQGNLEKKQNVFDDLIGCAEHLIRRGYTTSERLAIRGGSNGGLLMGAVITQRPELFRAVVSSVGIYDMLRVELSPNGMFNTTEFGTVEHKGQFRAIHAYSPYHRVQDSTIYPAVLMVTGENDGRVNPYHSKKMTARLQRARSKGPIVLRTDADGGHGIGAGLGSVISEKTDIYSFLFDQLTMKL